MDRQRIRELENLTGLVLDPAERDMMVDDLSSVALYIKQMMTVDDVPLVESGNYLSPEIVSPNLQLWQTEKFRETVLFNPVTIQDNAPDWSDPYFQVCTLIKPADKKSL